MTLRTVESRLTRLRSRSGASSIAVQATDGGFTIWAKFPDSETPRLFGSGFYLRDALSAAERKIDAVVLEHVRKTEAKS